MIGVAGVNWKAQRWEKLAQTGFNSKLFVVVFGEMNEGEELDLCQNEM